MRQIKKEERQRGGKDFQRKRSISVLGKTNRKRLSETENTCCSIRVRPQRGGAGVVTGEALHFKAVSSFYAVWSSEEVW